MLQRAIACLFCKAITTRLQLRAQGLKSRLGLWVVSWVCRGKAGNTRLSTSSVLFSIRLNLWPSKWSLRYSVYLLYLYKSVQILTQLWGPEIYAALLLCACLFVPHSPHHPDAGASSTIDACWHMLAGDGRSMALFPADGDRVWRVYVHGHFLVRRWETRVSGKKCCIFCVYARKLDILVPKIFLPFLILRYFWT